MEVRAQVIEHHFADAAAAAAALAAAVSTLLGAAIAQRGVATLVVSGGKSPVPFFAALRVMPLDWSKVWITLADERWVDTTTADSNERLLRDHLLLDAAAAAQFVGLKSAFATAEAGLAASEAALAAVPRPFDVVVLGMGEDGHTASLFPKAEGLEAALDTEGRPALAAITPPDAPHPRITMTLSTLLDTRSVFLPLSGETKLEVYRTARKKHRPLKRPISAVLHQLRTAVEVFIVETPTAI